MAILINIQDIQAGCNGYRKGLCRSFVRSFVRWAGGRLRWEEEEKEEESFLFSYFFAFKTRNPGGYTKDLLL